MREVTPGTLLVWMAIMPADVMATLALGPIDEDEGLVNGESCRVCAALRPYAKRPTWAMYWLSEWHNEHDTNEGWYLRCVLIYVMAGWRGP